MQIITLAAVRLVLFARQHDVAHVAALSDGTIRIGSHGTTRDGAPCSMIDVIPATMRAVRDTLGY